MPSPLPWRQKEQGTGATLNLHSCASEDAIVSPVVTAAVTRASDILQDTKSSHCRRWCKNPRAHIPDMARVVRAWSTGAYEATGASLLLVFSELAAYTGTQACIHLSLLLP